MKALFCRCSCHVPFCKVFCRKELKENFWNRFSASYMNVKNMNDEKLIDVSNIEENLFSLHVCFQFANFIFVFTVVVMLSSQNLQHGVLQKYLRVYWSTTVVVCSGLIVFNSLQLRKSIRALAFPSQNQQSLQPLPLFTHHVNLCQVLFSLSKCLNKGIHSQPLIFTS